MKKFVTWGIFVLILGGYLYAKHTGLIEDQMGKDSWLMHRRAAGVVGVVGYLVGAFVGSAFASKKR